MVLTLDGSSNHVARVERKEGRSLVEEKIKYEADVDVKTAFNRLDYLIYSCVRTVFLAIIISTMILTEMRDTG